jgi:hypothetical protein
VQKGRGGGVKSDAAEEKEKKGVLLLWFKRKKGNELEKLSKLFLLFRFETEHTKSNHYSTKTTIHCLLFLEALIV